MYKYLFLFFSIIFLYQNPSEKKIDPIEAHFISIERRSNRIPKRVYSIFTPKIYWMLKNGWKSHVENKIQYEISKPQKTKIGTIYYIDVFDYDIEHYDPYRKRYKFIKYPNRLYCFDVINVTYEVAKIHIMDSNIVVVYYSRKYDNLYYKVTYDHNFEILNKSIIEK